MKSKQFENLQKYAFHADLPPSIQQLRSIGLNCLIEGLTSVLPQNLIKNTVSVQSGHLIIGKNKISYSDFSSILIVGGGKATGNMCVELVNILNQIESPITYQGLINIPYGQDFFNEIISPNQKSHVSINFCSHPIPDHSGVEGVKKMISLIRESPLDTLIIVLISGGGSALMPYPAENISLDDLQSVNKLLLDSGADINEVNCVRKHLSDFKGGNLARITHPRKTFSLVLSDVIGDDLQTIASGPTVPDLTTFQNSFDICNKYHIFDKLPVTVQQRIHAGISNKIPDTPKPQDLMFQSSQTNIIGSALTSTQTVINYIQNQKIPTKIISNELKGEAREYGSNLLQIIAKNPENYSIGAYVGTGEFTVSLKGKGTGGRNQEMLAGFLQKLDENPDNPLNFIDFVIIAAAFDGIEGNSPAMGGIIDSESLTRIRKMNLKISDYLDNNDTYSLFSHLGDSLISGQTGTNVNDMLLVLCKYF